MSSEAEVDTADFKRIKKIVKPHYRGSTLYMPIPLDIRKEMLKEAKKRGILGWLKDKVYSISDFLNQNATDFFGREIGKRNFPPLEIRYRRGEIKFSVRIILEGEEQK